MNQDTLLRSLLLAKGGLNKLRAHQKELKQVDLEDSLKSIPPGEWCVLHHPTQPVEYISFINSLVDEKFACVQIVCEVTHGQSNSFDPISFIKEKLSAGHNRRLRFAGYEKGSRIFYGGSDGLPGLIVDQFYDKAIIQINTAGLDRHRNEIKEEIERLIKGQAYFLDNPKYREKESLPSFESEKIPQLEIEENGLKYTLRPEVIQKVGFYYDHRENRSQLIQLVAKLNIKFNLGADLFCYAGAWGMSALRSGVKEVAFVDQGDFETEVNWALEKNGFQGRGTFHRLDVFKFLDEAIKQNKLFNIVLCDPPAFAKSFNQKDQALEGYSKLHRKVMKAAAPGALLAFSSCTHYVNHEEFQKNILEAAAKENKKLQLIYAGVQGWDHPIPSLMDKSNYIKSYFYLMES